MDKIPEWQYPLYKEKDRIAYEILEKLGRSRKYPKLDGSKQEIDEFIKLLIVSQKMRDWRRFWNVVMPELEKKVFNIPKMLEYGRKLEIKKGVNKSWAVFDQDERICVLLDEFSDANIEFIGTNDEIMEFIVRFLLSQLLQDWRGPKMAVVLECLENKTIKAVELNNLLKRWDYTEIF